MENRRFTNMNELPPTSNEVEVDARIDRLRNDMWTAEDAQLDAVRSQLDAEKSMRTYLDSRPNGGHWVESLDDAQEGRSPLDAGVFEGDVFYEAGKDSAGGKVIAVEAVRAMNGEQVYVVSTTLESNGSERHEPMTESELREYLAGKELVDGGHDRAMAEASKVDGGYKDRNTSAEGALNGSTAEQSKEGESTTATTPESADDSEDETHESEQGPTSKRRGLRGRGRGRGNSEDIQDATDSAKPMSTEAFRAWQAEQRVAQDAEDVAESSAQVGASAAAPIAAAGVASSKNDASVEQAANDISAAGTADTGEQRTPQADASSEIADGDNESLVDQNNTSDAKADDTEVESTPEAASADEEEPAVSQSKEVAVIDAPRTPEDILRNMVDLEPVAEAAFKAADEYRENNPRPRNFFGRMYDKARNSLSNLSSKANARTGLALAGSPEAGAEKSRKRLYVGLGAATLLAVAGGIAAWKYGFDNPFNNNNDAPLPPMPEGGSVDTVPDGDGGAGTSPETGSQLDFTVEPGQGGYEMFRNLGIDSQVWDANKATLLRDFPSDFYRMDNAGAVGIARPGELSQGAQDFLTQLKNAS